MAAYYALKSFAKEIYNARILLRIDNTTAVACINKMGSVRYTKLNKITRKIWIWCEKHNNFIVASYINTKLNTYADQESRTKVIETEYELCQDAFLQICETFGKPSIDLFATHLNKKCKRYISWKPDPSSIEVDALTVSWKNEFFYAFPPFSLIQNCLRKIINEESQGIMVVPSWGTQPWYPVFKKLLVEEPLIFKPNKELLLSPFRDIHPLWSSLSLEVGLLSGRLFSREDFPKLDCML